MQSLYFLIPTFLILLLMVPIFLEVKVSFNAIDNRGTFCIRVFKINLQYFFFEIDGNQIKIKNKEAVDEKELSFDSPEVALYEQFAAEIKDKTRLRFLEVNYNIGLDDAFLTSMVCGMIDVAALIFFTAIKNKKPTASLAIYDTVSFNKKEAEVAVDLSVSISLFDVVYSFVLSVILSKKKARQLAN